MGTNQDRLLKLRERQVIALERIVQILEQSLPSQTAPDYRAILENFHVFDWSSIGAKVSRSKNHLASGDRQIL